MRSLKTACTTPLLLTLSMLFYSSAHQVDTLDAFTSASKRMQVKAGLVSSSMLAIQWYEWYDLTHVDAYLLMWGKESEVFTDTISLQPKGKSDSLIVINDLEENTKYYAQFYRVYEENVIVATPFEFTTLSVTKVTRRSVTNNLFLSDNISEVVVFTTDGKEIVHQAFTEKTGIRGILSNLTTPGMYLVSYRAGKKRIRSERILIGQ
jgi:hypothetical protein